MSYFKPNLLLSKTTTTGGDTASHYYSAYYMKNNLLPIGQVSGWTQGNYAGFPIFQFYFFLPFLVIALMSYVIPLEISFKLISVLGIFLLPLAAYFSMRKMKFKFPIPIFSAIFMLPFLFMEANSMWGGNIPSNLAGEFSYGISLALTVLFFGLIYSEINKEENSRFLPSVILLVLITFTHVYTLLFVVLSSGYFLLESDRRKLIRNLKFLFKIYLISFLLVGFWAIPMVLNLSNTTPFAIVWNIKGLGEVFPTILVPFYLLAILGVFRSIQKSDKRILFVSFSLIVGSFLYFFATKLGIVDIRFIPFIQLFPLFISAYGLGELTKKLRGGKLLPLIAVIATILWINQNVTFIPNWIEWNYEGFENKQIWGSYIGVNEFLTGDFNDPRVVYEHSPLHNSAGTSRAFESLPLFSGRPTLEGLYMQSSISAPFIFYTQSEISKVTSCPFPQWPCTNFNSTGASSHLEMFNVEHIIARTDETKTALKSDPNYEFLKSIGPYDIFELSINQNRYVIVPEFEPILFETNRWKEVSYLWFINHETLDIPLVFTDDAEKRGNFKVVKSDGRLEDLQKIPIDKDCSVGENVSNDEILIKTNCPGLPHIIRISNFPNWKVEGASEIYLVSPSFMLIFPDREDVRIYYGMTFVDTIGLILSLLGVVAMVFEKRISGKITSMIPDERFDEYLESLNKYKIWIIIFGILIVFGLLITYNNSHHTSMLKDDRFGIEL
ncbi:MAG: 6-pyruvoyl-tetrahydropterin synthase-related protein, partial [Candidatus Hodarchaeales archaeon]